MYELHKQMHYLNLLSLLKLLLRYNFLLLMVLFAITPAVFVLVWLIRTIKRLITEAKDKTVTAIEEKIEQKKEEHYVRTGI